MSPSYRRRLRAHSALAGVPWRQARAAVASAGCMVTELPWLWLRPLDPPLGSSLQWVGTEHADAALAQGRGLVLMTPHLGCFEMLAQGWAERYGAAWPMTALYRPARQAALRGIMEASRQRPGLKTAPAQLSGVRQMIRALRQGEAVGLLPDQVPPDGQGVWAPFFGKPAYTMTLAARLVQQTGAACLLMRCERLPRGAGFRIHVMPLPAALPTADTLPPAQAGDTRSAADRLALAGATAINQAMEHLIRQQPGQYLWGYHRYKKPRQDSAAPVTSHAGAA